ncbi:hypothetical protein ACIQWL_37590 [Streptomyces mirabilis]|uniref:hypothetical protein n=1 Tax=Streptomyces mirabilis TaxID=68239 RepID=UPI003816D95E
MIDVIAFIALVISLSAMSLCHQRREFPGMAWLRRRAPRRTSRDSTARTRSTRPARQPHNATLAALLEQTVTGSCPFYGIVAGRAPATIVRE